MWKYLHVCIDEEDRFNDGCYRTLCDIKKSTANRFELISKLISLRCIFLFSLPKVRHKKSRLLLSLSSIPKGPIRSAEKHNVTIQCVVHTAQTYSEHSCAYIVDFMQTIDLRRRISSFHLFGGFSKEQKKQKEIIYFRVCTFAT